MIVDNKIAELVCELEHRIGSQTYNPHSYNGWTGEVGCSFRYPVQYCQSKNDLETKKITKTSDQIYYIDPDCINTMKYAFGSNHLYIGDGIIEMLSYLEQKYKIDFNALEEKLIEKKRKRMQKEAVNIDNGKTYFCLDGEGTVGIDIPIGTFKVGKASIGVAWLIIKIWDENGIEVVNIETEDDEVIVEFKEDYRFYFFDRYTLSRA